MERKSNEPIDDIKIFINSDKNGDNDCGFEEIKNTVGVNWNDAKSLSTVEIKKSATDEMIFIINGKEYTKKEMKDKIIELDGAIEINEDEKSDDNITFAKINSSGSINNEPTIYLNDKEISKVEMYKINPKTIKSVDVKKEKSNREIRIETSYNYIDKNPEIIVNNKVISLEDLNKLDKNEIESINIKNSNDKKFIEIQRKNGKAITDSSLKEVKYVSETEEAKNEYIKAKIELEKAKAEIEKAKTEIEKAKLELEKAKANIDKNKTINKKK